MFVLALECSTARGSLALGWRAADEPPVECWRAEFATGRGQGGKMFTALAEALALVREDREVLDQIVVGLGPGSYSGVRQAIAAATGLAAATGARLVGVPSSAALDVDAPRYHAVGDARRGTFYYTAVENGVCVVGPELLEDQDALRSRLALRPAWPVFAVETVPDGLAADTPVAWPTALSRLIGSTDAPLYPPLEPIYLRAVAFTLPRTTARSVP